MLALLLRAGRLPTDPGVAALLEELLVAGSATTATAALSALVALSAQPALARAAQGEAFACLAALSSSEGARGDARPLPPAASWPLLCACVREGMRLNPPAPLIFRIATADARLVGPSGETLAIARAGSAVVMSAAVLAADAAAWDGAGDFLPERWLAQPDAVRDRRLGSMAAALAEMSFGAGPRSCAGSQLAMAVAPVIVASVLRDWPTES